MSQCMETLETEMAALENQKKKIEAELNSGDLDHETLFKKSDEISQVTQMLHEKEMRWLELSEKG